jgi:hypothetical protein
LDFVTFHVSVGSSLQAHPNHTSKHQEYISMIDMMFASARLADKSARIVVLTNRNTDLRNCSTHIDAIVRSDVDTSKLMLERAQNQLRYVEKSNFEAPIVILDSDILINAPLEPVFNLDFDVALTWRANKDQPINGGLFILNNIRPNVSRQFFRKFCAIFRERYSDQARWYGDQLALRDCVGIPSTQIRGMPLVEVDGCRILLLPCEIYNFSPDNKYSSIKVDQPDKVVLHFKGQRKRLMAPYWYAWLRPRKSFSPFVHLRAMRERKAIARLLASEVTGASDSSELKA